jgi:hypothetical protein
MSQTTSTVRQSLGFVASDCEPKGSAALPFSGMSTKRNLPKKRADYPDQTPGSKLAAEVRKAANGLSEAQREELFKRGMQVIYGGSGDKEAARTRH